MARLTDAGRFFLLLIFLAAIFAAALGQTPRSAEDLFKRAQQRLNENDIEGAIADLTIVIELTSSLQSGEFRARDSPNGAWRIVDTPGTKGVRVVDPRTAAAFNARGMAKFVKRDYDGAIADFDSALRISPGFAEAHFRRGIVWETKGDFERALADYDRALKLNPRLAKAHNQRGVAHYSRGAVEAAIYDFSRAIELSPRFAEAYSNRGLSRQSKGDWRNAIADLEAIALNPREAESYALRGLAKLEQGRQTEAESDFAQSFALTPDLRLKLAERIEEAKRKLAPKRLVHRTTQVILRKRANHIWPIRQTEPALYTNESGLGSSSDPRRSFGFSHK